MTERRKPRPALAVLRGKIRQIEERMARLEDYLKVLRVEASRSSGLARIRLKRLERRARVQVGRAQRTLKDSVSRLSQALAVAKTRDEVARHVARARARLEDSVQTLAQSTKGVKREMSLLGRGLKAGLRAGTEAYRRKRD